MTLLNDLRYALRGLAKSPGFTVMAVLALALGIGANAAIFSLVNAVMLRPLPYPQVERLYLPHLSVSGGNALGPDRMPWSYPKWQTFLSSQTSFESLAGFTDESFNLTSGGDPERVQAELVSPTYFGILGQRPVLGGLLPAGSERADGGDRVALIGEGLWQRRFGSDPAVIGRAIELDKKMFTVVGVLPRSFHGLTGKADIWVPISAVQFLWYPEALTEAGNHWLNGIGRVRPGTAPAALGAAMLAAGKAVDAANPRPAEDRDGSVWSAGAVSLAEARHDPSLRRALLVLLGAVVAVLFIACVNLGNLLWFAPDPGGARLPSAPRSAPAEVNCCVSCWPRACCSPGSAGLWPARRAAHLTCCARFTRARSPAGVCRRSRARLASASIDLRVFLFGLALAAVVGMATGMAPALRASRLGVAGALRRAAPCSPRARASLRGWGRAALVPASSALALVLLAGAGLLPGASASCRARDRLQARPLADRRVQTGRG